ncbi:MAG TPA: HAD domain-containing protein [Ramlibacter sp.]|nr:HAD domain-containing protein [Ramlibacter sp.]
MVIMSGQSGCERDGMDRTDAARVLQADRRAGCILFLDFDGVTHPDPCQAGRQFRRLPLIEEVLREFEACRIVISSSWRVVHRLDEMRGYFAADMRRRVIDVTPACCGPDGQPDFALSAHRQWECEAWLSEKGHLLLPNRDVGAAWLAIDDRDDWFRPGCGNLLVTDATTGFGPDDAVRLRSMLKQRME